MTEAAAISLGEQMALASLSLRAALRDLERLETTLRVEGVGAHVEPYGLARNLIRSALERLEHGTAAAGAELARMLVEAMPEYPKEGTP